MFLNLLLGDPKKDGVPFTRVDGRSSHFIRKPRKKIKMIEENPQFHFIPSISSYFHILKNNHIYMYMYMYTSLYIHNIYTYIIYTMSIYNN